MFGSIFKSGYDNLNATDFAEGFKNDPNAVIIDVRTPGEYKEGHIKGAKLIDVTGPAFSTLIQEQDKSKTYYVYCRSGGRSGSACSAMHKMGFEKVYNLSGGMMGWNGAVER